MNYEDAAKFKKGRDAARNALSKAVADLCSKYELSTFEVLHAIVDKAVVNAESQAQNYPTIYPLTISNGLAETYHAHTLALSEKAYAQANGLDEPAPAKKGGGLKGLFTKGPKPNVLYDPVAWSWDDPSEPTSQGPSKDDLYAAAKKAQFAQAYGLKPSKGTLTEYVPLKYTKHQEDWLGKAYQPQAAVGGTIAKNTVDWYGYELPEGYEFVPTPWGSEYVVQPVGAEPAPEPKYPICAHWCGMGAQGKCLDVTFNPGDKNTYTGVFLDSYGIKPSYLEKFGPGGLTYTYVPNKDQIEVEYPL